MIEGVPLLARSISPGEVRKASFWKVGRGIEYVGHNAFTDVKNQNIIRVLDDFATDVSAQPTYLPM